MGFGYWIRRLFTVFAASADARPCNLCREPIPPSHFKSGRAVMIAQRCYCAGCVAEITTRKPEKPSVGGNWTVAGADAGSSSTIHLP